MSRMLKIILLTIMMVTIQTSQASIKSLERDIAALKVELKKVQENKGRLEDEIDILKRRMNKLEQYEIFKFEATGYSPYDDRTGLNHDGCYTVTATGTQPRPGVVAVNPEIIPYGTKLYVQDYGWAIAEDTGGAMRNRTNLIDLYFDTHEEACIWGRRKVWIVVKKGVINYEPTQN